MDTHDIDDRHQTDMIVDEVLKKANHNNNIKKPIINQNEDEIWSEDELALGASASPTGSASYNVPPVPPAPPALPPAFDYMDASASSSKSTFRRLNSGDRSNNFVGLVNQAMTCYLNSLLQALFMTPEFRNALYNWEFDGKDESKSIPYQLQKLFLNLQVNYYFSSFFTTVAFFLWKERDRTSNSSRSILIMSE